MQITLKGVFQEPAKNQRKPLEQPTLRSIWRGSVYVNPVTESARWGFNHIAHFFRDPKFWRVGNSKSVILTKDRISVNDPFRGLAVYDYAYGCKVEIHGLVNKKPTRRRPYTGWLRIYLNRTWTVIPFKFDQKTSWRITEIIIEAEVSFREYVDGRPAFKGTPVNFIERTQLKNTFKISW